MAQTTATAYKREPDPRLLAEPKIEDIFGRKCLKHLKRQNITIDLTVVLLRLLLGIKGKAKNK